MKRYPVKKWCVTAFLLLVLAAMGAYSYWKGNLRSKLVYPESLDMVTATVNGEDLTLREVAFYVAYEEEEVERQAYVYDPDDTNVYWNLHANNTYIRNAARNAAIQMAIHDELFYQMALSEELTLSEEEEALLEEQVEETWEDLTDYGKDVRLGVVREDIAQTLEKIAYAEKMQYIYANVQGLDEEDFYFYSDSYLDFLDKQDYKIAEDVWGRVDFGNVTLTHWGT
jgi:hypothetical protein